MVYVPSIGIPRMVDGHVAYTSAQPIIQFKDNDSEMRHREFRMWIEKCPTALKRATPAIKRHVAT